MLGMFFLGHVSGAEISDVRSSAVMECRSGHEQEPNWKDKFAIHGASSRRVSVSNTRLTSPASSPRATPFPGRATVELPSVLLRIPALRHREEPLQLDGEGAGDFALASVSVRSITSCRAFVNFGVGGATVTTGHVFGGHRLCESCAPVLLGPPLVQQQQQQPTKHGMLEPISRFRTAPGPIESQPVLRCTCLLSAGFAIFHVDSLGHFVPSGMCRRAVTSGRLLLLTFQKCSDLLCGAHEQLANDFVRPCFGNSGLVGNGLPALVQAQLRFRRCAARKMSSSPMSCRPACCAPAHLAHLAQLVGSQVPESDHLRLSPGKGLGCKLWRLQVRSDMPALSEATPPIASCRCTGEFCRYLRCFSEGSPPGGAPLPQMAGKKAVDCWRPRALRSSTVAEPLLGPVPARRTAELLRGSALQKPACCSAAVPVPLPAFLQHSSSALARTSHVAACQNRLRWADAACLFHACTVRHGWSLPHSSGGASLRVSPLQVSSDTDIASSSIRSSQAKAPMVHSLMSSTLDCLTRDSLREVSVSIQWQHAVAEPRRQGSGLVGHVLWAAFQAREAQLFQQ
ncbi:unnamed protein product [Polarella glacialis]|uniref:Uncharacterized protein n=1 Tax=Polarella glacialis TaxID=89957 RepID=A0A813LUD9_POLGL|nr:unnamed protein product [Polarella glacialis]